MVEASGSRFTPRTRGVTCSVPLGWIRGFEVAFDVLSSRAKGTNQLTKWVRMPSRLLVRVQGTPIFRTYSGSAMVLRWRTLGLRPSFSGALKTPESRLGPGVWAREASSSVAPTRNAE